MTNNVIDWQGGKMTQAKIAEKYRSECILISEILELNYLPEETRHTFEIMKSIIHDLITELENEE